MASQTASALRRAIRSMAGADQQQVTDRDLLLRFVEKDDQAAFAALVDRHSGMVMGVCRRVLSHRQDTEDAVQATFLLLARKARSSHWQPSVASWLYATARNVAHNARLAAQRRARREVRAVPLSVGTVDRMTGRELLAALDAELDKLPPRYREPLVLCYLEGLTRDEAAARLNVPTATLKSQLERGRKKLHDALTKGGCALGAGLLALAVTSPAGASSPRLVHAILAAASGSVPDAVAELAKGVAVNGFAKHVGLILVALVGVVALGIGLGSQTSPVVGQPPDKPAQAANDKPADPAGSHEIIVTGKVLDGDGKPLAGAQVASGAVKATTGADGQFRFPVAKADPYERVVVTAVAKGHGPDWAVLDDDKGGEITLRLTADDVPLTGRIATLENQPLKDVTVEIVRLGRPSEGDLMAWVDKNVKMRREHYWLNENGLTTVGGNLALEKAKTTTGADGKFTLAGVGRDRVLTVKVYGPNVETKFFWVVTRQGGPKEGYIMTKDFNHGLYPPDVTVLLAPSRPLIGTVRDAKTGKPVAGVTVSEVNNHIPKSVTDADGKYRIEGVPKKPWYGFNVAGTKGLPYFDHSLFGVTDTVGLDELETNLTIERGLELTGRIVDKAGRPVLAEVHYSPLDNNPNAKPSLQRVISSDGWKTKPDGTFYLTVWPGQGVIDVRANDRDRYAIVDAEKILSQLGVKSRPVGGVNALLPIDADEVKPESLTITVTLDEAAIRKGSVVDPDGKPLAGAAVGGLKAGGSPSELTTADFTLAGMSAESHRLLVVLHDEKKLGAVQTVSGAEKGPLVVKLQPLGTVAGEVRTEDGKPWAKLTVTALPQIPDAKKYENLPTETQRFQGGLGMTRAPWSSLTRKSATTDKDGRFRVEGLLPGLEYTLYVSEGDLGERDTLVTSRRKVAIEAGKVIEVGVLKKGDAR